MSLDKTINNLLQVFKEAGKKGTQPYDTQAEVKRIEDGIAWVHIPGGVDETPVKLTIDAKPGDSIQVRVGGGNAWITGNSTSPPTDDTQATVAKLLAKLARKKATQAQAIAEGAVSMAGTAQETADSAMVSANGKNKIYRQNSQPSGGTYVTGDTWFDTGHDNKIYRYDGSSWVAVVLGDDALESLSANKITAGTIDASQITVSNLDAGNITSGYLSADRIAANSITIGKTTGIASSTDATNAAKTATSYIVNLDSNNGVRIQSLNTSNNRVDVTSSGMDVVIGNVSVANYGATARIGKASATHVSVGSSVVDFYKDASTRFGSIQVSGSEFKFCVPRGTYGESGISVDTSNYGSVDLYRTGNVSQKYTSGLSIYPSAEGSSTCNMSLFSISNFYFSDQSTSYRLANSGHGYFNNVYSNGSKVPTLDTQESISIRSHTVSISNLAAKSSVDGSPSCAVSGWNPRCVVGWYPSGSNTSWASVWKAFVNQDEDKLYWGVRNVNTDTTKPFASGATMTFEVLYTKSS